MSTPTTFRAATAGDIIAIASLLTQLNRAEGNSAVADAEALRRALFHGPHPVQLRALVAEEGGRVTAAALYYAGYDVLSATYGYHLADFVVDETLRRRGIGRALFASLAQQNLAEGGKWLSLTALTHNLYANAFYNALGLTQVPVDFFAIGERGMVDVATLLQK